MSDPRRAADAPARLREHPRRLEGRCARCRFLDLCNGSSRVRAKIGAGAIRTVHGVGYALQEPS